MQWDALQTKIAAAAQAHSYFADVADVDWSKVGEYYATKWFMPLNKYFPLSSVRSQFPQAPAFIRNGELMGMPMDGSLLVTTMNEKDLKARRRHQGPDDACPVRDRPQGDRLEDRRPRTRWTSRSPRPRASRPTGTR